MRRRQGAGQAPERLRVFRRESWPGRDDAEAYSAFVAAREAWKDERGIDVLPDDEAISEAFPDGTWKVWGDV